VRRKVVPAVLGDLVAEVVVRLLAEELDEQVTHRPVRPIEASMQLPVLGTDLVPPLIGDVGVERPATIAERPRVGHEGPAQVGDRLSTLARPKRSRHSGILAATRPQAPPEWSSERPPTYASGRSDMSADAAGHSSSW